MSTKFMSFLTMSWFLSTLICIVLEGTYFGNTQKSIINGLTIFTNYPIGGLFKIPVLNFDFFSSLYRILLWDYSFYTGWYTLLRWFWLAILSPGAVWGLYQITIWLYGSLISLFRLL
jgi:hypothetical protein